MLFPLIKIIYWAVYYWVYLLRNEYNLFDSCSVFIVDGNCKKNKEQCKTVLHTLNNWEMIVLFKDLKYH